MQKATLRLMQAAFCICEEFDNREPTIPASLFSALLVS
jgi:hypothetical protein